MRKYLGEILVEMEAVMESQVESALQEQMDGDQRMVGEILLSRQQCTAEDIARALAEQNGMRFIDLEVLDLPPAVTGLVSRDIASANLVMPVGVRENTLTLAMANPFDLGTIDSLRFSTGMTIEPAVASEEQIKRAIERVHGLTEAKLDQMLGEMTSNIEYRSDQDEDGEGEDSAPVIRYVTQILQNAMDSGASDIHVEPMADRLRIRYRIDGVCFTMDPAPKRLQGPVIQRMKIMAGVQVEEKRKPQDGRIKINLRDKVLDLRFSTLPAVFGESIVLRVLDSKNLELTLDDMGFDPTDFKRFKSLIAKPNGIMLVTGPTGSGKTTTLYATLGSLNTTDRKIITAEDPVEYMLEGINQCQVNKAIGLDFPRILRSMLRQAPNIILVGEIRDYETAAIAVNASLTGHLVFSTLHTNDAPSAVTRLTDMGVKPFLVATSVQAVLAQRLLRINCQSCIEPFEADPAHLAALNVTTEQLEGRTLMRGRGCDRCKGSGYKGRRGAFELMVLNAEIRKLVFEEASTEDIRQAAIANGMHTLAMDGTRKALQGLTTPEEVLRIAKADEH